ncbi:hypothetical protein [Alkalimarinus coralli]|uniref:hypothetical protein n=1 Tax=Alkalimarinus coralli TaxID=2935863 RepID=UPI00202AF74F|nr:hypothetical protein [Alkalimarinus coralli]
MFMRLFFVWMLASIAAGVHAGCVNQGGPIGAHYRITTTENESGKQRVKAFTLWRMADQVAHQYHGKGKTELWERAGNGKLRTVHYFDLYHRGIEYAPGEIRIAHTATDWQLKYQLLSDKFIETLTREASLVEDCEPLLQYSKTAEGEKITLAWLPEQRLIKSYISERPFVTTTWELLDVVTDSDKVQGEFARRAEFQTTDYTDIGDNESDPFLMRMINLGHISHGASGFYDQHGHLIGGNHGH